MNKYFLNQDVLMAVCYFHGTVSGQARSSWEPHIKERCIQKLNSQLFRDLLIKQPELTDIYDLYISKIKEGNVYPSTLFTEMFADKIEINNLKSQLLTKNYDFKDKVKRQNVFKYLLEKHPPFLSLVHDFIKENKEANNTFLSEDTLLYNFYFKSLKSNNSIRLSLDTKEVLANIDFFNSPFEIALNKKKLNAYILHFPNDMILYKHIMENMGVLIKNDAVFKQLWEEKINLFPKDIQDEYYKQNITIQPWDERLSYHYKFQVNEEYFIEQSKVVATKAERLGRVFHNTLGSIIQNKFNPIEETRTGIPSVSFLFSNEADRERARRFCNYVSENVLFLIKNSNYELQYQEQYDLMDISLQKMYMAFTFTEDLNAAVPERKTKKTNKL